MSAGSTVFADVEYGDNRVRLLVTLEASGLWEVQAIDVLRRTITWRQASLATKDIARSKARDWVLETFGVDELQWRRGAASSTA